MGIDERYGVDGDFYVGDIVWCMGNRGTVVATFESPKIRDVDLSLVPVSFTSFDLMAYVPDYHLTNYSAQVREEHPPAKLGDPAYSGVWQPTGEKFEVMFHGDDQVGTFYIRERSDR